MGAPATKIEGVTVTSVVTNSPTQRWVSHENIIQAKSVSIGTVTLNIPGQDPLPGIWNGKSVVRNKWSNYPDPDPEAELLIMGKVVWTFTGEGTTGTFEGVVQRIITGWSLTGPIAGTTFEDHAVFQGTGDFKGQTLKLSYEGPPPVLEGYLIIPK